MEIVREIMPTLVMSVVTILAALAAKLIQAKTRDTLVRTTLLRIVDAVESAVREAQQKSVDSILARDPAIKRTTELERVKRSVENKAKDILGPKELRRSAKELGLTEAGLNTLIESRIESTVLGLRREAAAINAVQKKTAVQSSPAG